MSRRGRVLSALASFAAAIAVAAAGQAAQTPPAADTHAVWDGARTTPVHLIPLRDENDELIVPTETDPLPYSARFTCGPCHDYATVSGGWHFAGKASANDGRPGEPWLQFDPRTGTVLPLSYRKWPGLYDPAAAGLTAWDFTLLFGRHMPGGGAAEPPDEEVLAHPEARWNVSGRAEANCLACHNGSGRQDPSEWAKQILRENLRWAATAAGGLGEVSGMASRLKETWDVVDGPNLDDHLWAVAPSVKYRAADFDSKQRTFFDLDHKPADANCLACHAVSPAGEAQWTADGDVHAAAGLTCADCHRNGLDHAMVRGYEGEADETGNRPAEAFTCRGCHLGENAKGEKKVVPGRLGAPFPKHTGLPLVHFKRLACTVCHSGPMPKDGFTRVRTSRANRLGIYGVATWATEAPVLVEPVYKKDGRGRIAPHRLVWPAYWAKRAGQDLVPLQPKAVEAAAGDFLKPEERIAQTLAALGQTLAEDETPVLVSGGFVFAPNVDLGLDASSRPEGAGDGAAPAFWALRTAAGIAPLVPDFDPASPDKDPSVDARFQDFLQALATTPGKPGEPVFLVRSTLYRIVDGFLDASEAPADLGGAPGPGWIVEGKLVPLAADFDIGTVTAKAGTDKTLTEEQVGLVLAALRKADDQAEFVYISGGRLFRLDKKGRLESVKDEAAEPVTWPLAHGVRPAQQSLGWKGCTDCHSGGSDFFFGRLEGTGPLLTASVAERSASSFMGLGGLFQRVFGLSFIVRPALKIVLGVCAAVIGALLFLAGLVALGRVAGFLEKR